jgi:hypothetical protein
MDVLENQACLAFLTDLEIPIGTQDTELLDTRNGDEDSDSVAIALRIDDRLCLVHEDEQQREPQIICSLGLF